MKETLPSYLLVIIPLNQPIGQSDVIHGLIVLVSSYALPRESIELLKLGSLQLEASL